MDNGNEFVPGLLLFTCWAELWVKNVEADMPLDDFGHECIHCPSAGRQCEQHGGTIAFLVEGFLHGVQLPTHAPHPMKQFGFVLDGVSHNSSKMTTNPYTQRGYMSTTRLAAIVRAE